jgi:hypothetical protein
MEQRDMPYYFSYLYCVPSRAPAAKVEPELDSALTSNYKKRLAHVTLAQCGNSPLRFRDGTSSSVPIPLSLLGFVARLIVVLVSPRGQRSEI